MYLKKKIFIIFKLYPLVYIGDFNTQGIYAILCEHVAMRDEIFFKLYGIFPGHSEINF